MLVISPQRQSNSLSVTFNKLNLESIRSIYLFELIRNSPFVIVIVLSGLSSEGGYLPKKWCHGAVGTAGAP